MSFSNSNRYVKVSKESLDALGSLKMTKTTFSPLLKSFLALAFSRMVFPVPNGDVNKTRFLVSSSSLRTEYCAVVQKSFFLKDVTASSFLSES